MGQQKELPSISTEFKSGLRVIAQDPDFNEQDEAFLKSVGVGEVEMTDYKNNARSNITENTCLYCAHNFTDEHRPQGLLSNENGMKKPKPYSKEVGPNPVGKGYNLKPLPVGTTDPQDSQWSQPYSGILPAVIITDGVDLADTVSPDNNPILKNYDRVLLSPPGVEKDPTYEGTMFYFRKNSAAPVSGN